MKVFVPMSDKLQDVNGRLSGNLVPFNPEFMSRAEQHLKDRKPANWIGQSGYHSGSERIQVIQMVDSGGQVAV